MTFIGTDLLHTDLVN